MASPSASTSLSLSLSLSCQKQTQIRRTLCHLGQTGRPYAANRVTTAMKTSWLKRGRDLTWTDPLPFFFKTRVERTAGQGALNAPPLSIRALLFPPPEFRADLLVPLRNETKITDTPAHCTPVYGSIARPVPFFSFSYFPETDHEFEFKL